MSKARNRGIDITKEIFANNKEKKGSVDSGANDNNIKEGYQRRNTRNDYSHSYNKNDRPQKGYNNGRRYNNRDEPDGWNRGSEFEKYSKEVDETQQQESSSLKFFDRGLSRDEIKLRNYIYNYLKINLEQQIKDNQDTGNSTDKLVFNIKEDDIIKDVFNGDPDRKINVYDMLNRKRESHKDNDRSSRAQLFNPIASSVFKALNGFEPDKEFNSNRILYSGLSIKNVNIELSHFSNYVWSVIVLMKNDKLDKKNYSSKNNWNRQPKTRSPTMPHQNGNNTTSVNDVKDE